MKERKKLVTSGLCENKSALVQVMAKRRGSDKPLIEPMLTELHGAT